MGAAEDSGAADLALGLPRLALGLWTEPPPGPGLAAPCTATPGPRGHGQSRLPPEDPLCLAFGLLPDVVAQRPGTLVTTVSQSRRLSRVLGPRLIEARILLPLLPHTDGCSHGRESRVTAWGPLATAGGGTQRTRGPCPGHPSRRGHGPGYRVRTQGWGHSLRCCCCCCWGARARSEQKHRDPSLWTQPACPERSDLPGWGIQKHQVPGSGGNTLSGNLLQFRPGPGCPCAGARP